ncbi:hypothetical protein [Prosthecochloris vibrioformis]|uniref:hypothetical protein n=1 Tax=Prosthecochloris vibrioformis TaxID=1098 RepID=UPI0014777FCB|nr:hypothetical protein [Prosthecochloris vibrioformis]
MAKQLKSHSDKLTTDHDKNTLNLSTNDPNKSMGEVLAGEVLKGHANSTLLLNNLLRGAYGETAGLNDWKRGLEQTTKAVKAGDLSDIEGMLLGQAYALDALFLNLIRSALDTSLMPQLDTLTRLALKAQNQSRATAQTLAAIKNPQQTVFMKQANIANGPQQVNNNFTEQPQSQGSDGEKSPTTSPKNFKTEQNELLKAHEEIDRLDTGATRPSSRDDQEMETLGKVNRPKNRVRKSSRSKKR